MPCTVSGTGECRRQRLWPRPQQSLLRCTTPRPPASAWIGERLSAQWQLTKRRRAARQQDTLPPPLGHHRPSVPRRRAAGGPLGLHRRVFEANRQENEENVAVVLRYTSSDGEEG